MCFIMEEVLGCIDGATPEPVVQAVVVVGAAVVAGALVVAAAVVCAAIRVKVSVWACGGYGTERRQGSRDNLVLG